MSSHAETLATGLTVTQLALLTCKSTANTGFNVAISSTKFGFKLVRAVWSPIISVVGAVADTSIGTNTQSGEFGGLITQSLNGLLDASEYLALFGINIGSQVTKATLDLAHSGVASISEVYGNDEALRALGTFLELIQEEYASSLPTDPFRTGGLSTWSALELSKAAATWAALQSVTQELYGRQLAPEISELDIKQWIQPDGVEDDDNAMIWQVTEEEILNTGEEVIAASSTGSNKLNDQTTISNEEITRDHLRRFSKLCLGSYGGMGMLFFGVTLPTSSESSSSSTSTSTPLTIAALETLEREQDDNTLSDVLGTGALSLPTAPLVDDGEEQSILDELAGVGSIHDAEETTEKPRSLWNIINGAHDLEVLEKIGGVNLNGNSASIEIGGEADSDDDESSNKSEDIAAQLLRRKARENRKRQEKKGRRPPRYFVITDHQTKSILLVLRGTLSIDDVATDLACATSLFDETLHWDDVELEDERTGKQYQVHGGMFEIAQSMGGTASSPVTRAVAKALNKNEDYALFLIGHSLGAGIASLLGILWSNPGTSLTAHKSGLPPGRKVRVYGFAPPCTTDEKLSFRCRKLIHSFVYSFDVVTRFSLGHIRDIRSATAWLCYNSGESPEESCNQILARIISFKRGNLDSDPKKKAEEQLWFNSLKLTLEANMNYADLYPPGEIFWLIRSDDLILPQDLTTALDPDISNEPRLFRVTGDVDKVFRQMVFTKTMLSSHLPHEYANAIDSFF